jgi:hypothetical protein
VHKANLGSQLSIFDTGSSARARPRPNDPPERVQPGALKRPARTTETKRQGRAGQTSCTSVHKSILGSQLSIFDTGSSARARPRPNDPPIRVQPGALKRPARTNETKRQGRAGQKSCTSVHKANLGSQLSIFDTGSSARARPRPNDFNRAPSNDPPERPKRSDKGEPGKRAARACTKPTSGHNLPFLIRARPPGRALARTTRPNEFNRAPSNDPPERPKRSDKGEPGKRAAQACTNPTSGHNLAFLIRARPPGRALARTTRPNEFKRAPSNDPPERPKRSDKGEPGKRAARACTKPTSGHNLAFLIRARPPGRALARTTRPYEFNRAPSNDPPERPKRSDKGEPGKRAARACTNPTSGHNLAFLIRARPPGRALARTTRPNEFKRAPSNDPPERPKRSDKGEPGKRAARACTKPTSGHNLAFLIRARPPGRALARTTRPNEFNRAPSNDPPERPKRSDKGEPGKRAARACTNPTSGHNLAFLIRARPPGRALARTTRPYEFNRAPSNDPPERPKRRDKGEPGKRAARACTKPTSGHNLAFLIRARPPGRALARTTRPNEFNRAPSNDPPERPKRSDKGGPGKRAARACTKPTSGHNLAFLIRARPPGRALARTTRPNEFNRAPSNDPPERPKRSDKGETGKRAARACTKPTSGHNLAVLIRARPPGRALARTTRPNEFTRAPSNDPPERPKRSDKGEPGKRAARACTKPTSGHNLAFLIRARPPGRALARTTRLNEFTRAPSNDPPERVHPGALKRPARTTHPNEFTRAPSNDPPERPARTSSHGRPQTTRPNDFSWAPERPKRTDKGEPGKRAARTCTKPTSGHNLAFLIRPSPERPARTSSPGRPRTTRPNDPPERVHTGALKRPARTTHPNDPPERPTRTTRPNDFTRAPSNDPPERFFMGARTTETNRQGRAGQTSCTNVHKANLGSQLSIFDTALARTTRPNEFSRAPSNDPPERPTRTSSHGRPQTTRPNDPPERVQAGALKRPARTTRLNDPPERPARTSSHGRPQTTRPNDPPERPARTSSHGCPQTTRPNERPKRTDKGEAGKRAARACTKPTSGHNLAVLIRARPPGRALARTTRPNEFTRAPSNDPPERPKRSDKGEPGKRAARACTKPTSGHNLAFLIRARPPGRALARTTRPNEFTRAPSNDPPERVHPGALKRPARTSSPGRPQTTRPNDPPERVHTGALKRPARTPERPARTSSHGRPQTTRPNDFSWAPERPKRTDKGEPGKRAARTCTKPTSGHNLAFLIRPSPERPARTSSPGRPQTTRPNDPPERVHTGALKRPARTTRPNEFTRAPSNDPPERPA